MSAVAAKPQAGGAMNPTAMAVGVVMLLIILGVCWYISPGAGLTMIEMARLPSGENQVRPERPRPDF